LNHLLTLVLLLVSTGIADRTAADCTGWSGFRPPVRYAATADQEVLAADLDGDGAPEIVTSGDHVDELGTISVLANRGDGTLKEERLLISSFGEKLEDVGDVDLDGVPDILVSNYWSNGIALYRGIGNLRFGGGVPYPTATHGGPSKILDYDRDGRPDLVSLSFGSGNPVRVHLFRGRGDGTFEPKTTFETPLANGASPSTRTINGVLEILAAEHSGHLGILRIADGSLSVSTIDAGPGLDLTSTFADVNGDGIADIVYTTDGDLGGESDPLEPVFIRRGKADGTFLPREQFNQPRHIELPVGLAAGDFDGDGHVDLVVSDFRATRLYVFRGNGAGAFEEPAAFNTGGPVNRFKAADVNGDGRLDLVTVNDDHSVSVVINRGPCRAARRRAVTR
jgi:hypothetical protein